MKERAVSGRVIFALATTSTTWTTPVMLLSRRPGKAPTPSIRGQFLTALFGFIGACLSTRAAPARMPSGSRRANVGGAEPHSLTKARFPNARKRPPASGHGLLPARQLPLSKRIRTDGCSDAGQTSLRRHCAAPTIRTELTRPVPFGVKRTCRDNWRMSPFDPTRTSGPDRTR